MPDPTTPGAGPDGAAPIAPSPAPVATEAGQQPAVAPEVAPAAPATPAPVKTDWHEDPEFRKYDSRLQSERDTARNAADQLRNQVRQVEEENTRLQVAAQRAELAGHDVPAEAIDRFVAPQIAKLRNLELERGVDAAIKQIRREFPDLDIKDEDLGSLPVHLGPDVFLAQARVVASTKLLDVKQRALAVRERELETKQQQAELEDRRTNGADKLAGASETNPAPDLRRAYESERAKVRSGSRELMAIRDKYRLLGLTGL